jgi:hypothetical protein
MNAADLLRELLSFGNLSDGVLASRPPAAPTFNDGTSSNQQRLLRNHPGFWAVATLPRRIRTLTRSREAAKERVRFLEWSWNSQAAGRSSSLNTPESGFPDRPQSSYRLPLRGFAASREPVRVSLRRCRSARAQGIFHVSKVEGSAPCAAPKCGSLDSLALARDDIGSGVLTRDDLGSGVLARDDLGSGALARDDLGSGELAQAAKGNGALARNDLGSGALARDESASTPLARDENGSRPLDPNDGLSCPAGDLP